MSTRHSFIGAAVALVLGGCLTQPEFPGDKVIGTFRFEPRLIPTQEACGFAGVETIGPFVGTLSVDSATNRAWLTVDGSSREGTLDGQRFAVRSEGAREFTCGTDAEGVACKGLLRERVEGRLVGRLEASDSTTCDEAPGTGENAQDPDPNVQDAVLVCGFLTDQLVAAADASCGCEPCLFVYSLTGRRQ